MIEPFAAVLAAHWHHHGNREPHDGDCWCCCQDCDPECGGDNPHHAAAIRAGTGADDDAHRMPATIR